MADDLVSPLRAVCVLDPALDRAAMDGSFDEYVETRDPDLVRTRPGETPVICVLRALEPHEVAFASSVAGSSFGSSVGEATALAAFRCAAVRIENYPKPGVAFHPTGLPRKPDSFERDWSDEDIRGIMGSLGMDFIHEMGQVAYQRARAGKLWSGNVAFTLPLSSMRALDMMQRRRAALRSRSSSTASSDKSAASTEARPQPNSGAATDAPATAGTPTPGT